RHQRRLVRPDVAGDGQDLVGGRQLQVEPLRHHLPQQAQVAVLDVPAVLAQAAGGAVGAAEPAQHRRADRVGVVGQAPPPPRGTGCIWSTWWMLMPSRIMRWFSPPASRGVYPHGAGPWG